MNSFGNAPFWPLYENPLYVNWAAAGETAEYHASSVFSAAGTIPRHGEDSSSLLGSVGRPSTDAQLELRAAQFMLKPRLGKLPVAADRSRRTLQHFGGLPLAHTPEIAQLNHFGLARRDSSGGAARRLDSPVTGGYQYRMPVNLPDIGRVVLAAFALLLPGIALARLLDSPSRSRAGRA